MTIPEITKLRKDGNLSEAYNECKLLLNNQPDDKFVRISMAWCLKSISERCSDTVDDERMVKVLMQLSSLKLHEVGEQALNNKFVWDIRKLFIKRASNPDAVVALADNVFEQLKLMQFEKPQKYYSCLVSAFVLAKGRQSATWQHFVEFMDWWGFDNFMPADFERVKSSKRGQSIMSLAERAYSAYSKCLMEQHMAGNDMTAKIQAFLLRLDEISASHPEFTYTLLHKAKLLLLLNRKDEALQAIRLYARTKPIDFRVWKTLADTIDDDASRLACYCRVLSTISDTRFVGRERIKVAALMHQFGDDANAKLEIEQYVTTYRNAGWHIPQSVENMMAQDWYKSTEAAAQNTTYYSQHTALAEQLLYADMPEVAIIVTHYNPEKQVCQFVTSDHQHGFFYTTRIKFRFANNYIYRVRFAGELQPNEPSKILSCRVEKNTAPYENVFFKKLDGELKIPYGKTFGFVDDVFVDNGLMTGIDNGAKVKITAVVTFSPSKQTYGWRAVRLNCK